MQKLRAALWTDLKMLAPEKIQVDLECDTVVLQLFDDGFVASECPEHVPIILEATLKQWTDLAREWEWAKARETSRHLH